MTFVLVALLSFAQASAAPRTAPATPTAIPAQPASPVKAEKTKKTKKVCTTEDGESGTRFGRRVCRSIEEDGAKDTKPNGRD
jgi:hypothetical protein